MQTIQTICRDCHGFGRDVNENPCKTCNGLGYVEMACFTKEEAEKILKHCGLEE